MGGSPEEARARAEAKVKRQEQADQRAAEAKAEREAQEQALEAHTARLKSLRLVKEARGQGGGQAVRVFWQEGHRDEKEAGTLSEPLP